MKCIRAHSLSIWVLRNTHLLHIAVSGSKKKLHMTEIWYAYNLSFFFFSYRHRRNTKFQDSTILGTKTFFRNIPHVILFCSFANSLTIAPWKKVSIYLVRTKLTKNSCALNCVINLIPNGQERYLSVKELILKC